MKSHKRWHFLFTVSGWKTSRSTSYCGNYLRHDIKIEWTECTKCNILKADIKDLETGKVTRYPWMDYKVTKKIINEAIK